MDSREQTTEPDEVPPAQLIGPKIRAAREAQGMSLRELARRISVSPSFVSQLERNKANASVGTLYALVEALGLSLDQLMSKDRSGTADAGADQFSFAASGAPVIQRRPTVSEPKQPADTRARIQFPGVVWERLTKASDPFVDFLHVEYAPGSSSCPPNDMMRHGGHEYGFILSGRLEVQIGFETYALEPGDAVTFDSMTPHRLNNPHQEPCRAVWVVVGRRDDERGLTVPAPTGSVTHLPSLGA